MSTTVKLVEIRFHAEAGPEETHLGMGYQSILEIPVAEQYAAKG
jgi:hypothetical protein